MRRSRLTIKILGIALTCALAGAMLPLGAFISHSQVQASPGTIYVPDDYLTIQAAVNAASPGDTIIVRDGTYTENVDVSKDSLTIQSENGADTTIVQAANPDDHGFEVTGDYVSIIGFTIEGATGHPNSAWVSAGIFVGEFPSGAVTHCSILGNTLINNYHGVCLYYSSNNIIINNTADSNSTGICLAHSPANTLDANIVEANMWGIQINWSSYNFLTDNIISNNTWNFYVMGSDYSTYVQNIDISNTVNGKPIRYIIEENGLVIDSSWDVGYLALVDCREIVVKDLNLGNNGEGMLLAYTTDSTIEQVTLLSNPWGIYADHSSDNVFRYNTIGSNTRGISFGHDCFGNTVYFNDILDNLYGITLGYSTSSNVVYLNNFIDNYYDAQPSVSNTWNSPEQMPYTFNGNTYSSYLGNYWSDYAGSDVNGDGIGDTPYPIDPDSDNYPLMEPFENYGMGEPTPGNQQPIASILSLGGQPKTICPNIEYTVAAAYHDLDGMEDLKYCYLRLNHPTKPLTLMWNQATDEYWAWAGEEGANYIAVSGYTVPMYDTGYDLNWQFTINDAWPEVDNVIDFGLFAMDDQGAVSGWEYDDSNASFIVGTPLEVHAYEDESSRSWTRDSTTDLPICNSLVMYEITNIGNRVATNIDVNIEIDRDSFAQETIPSLAEGVTYTTACTLPIDYDSSSHIRITASAACYSDAYSFVIDASLPRTRLDDLAKLFITPNDAVVKDTLEIIRSSYPSPLPEWIAIRDWVGYFVDYASDKDEYGVADYFKLPRETIKDLRGDCEDFAILLVSLLRANGWGPNDVFVVVGKNSQNEWHGWVILNIDVLGWQTIEPQLDGLWTFWGDLFALHDYEAVDLFNDARFIRPSVIKALSPVDILVADPDGLILSKQLAEIPGAWYSEIDINGDGDLDDQLTIPEKKIGDYSVMVIPEPDSSPTDTYTLQISFNGTIITLAEDVEISEIPAGGYIIRSTETEIMQILPANINFVPDVLKLESKGKYVTVYIELPTGYDVTQIDVSTIRLNDTVPALAAPTAVGDYDTDGVPDLMVKFDASAVKSLLTPGSHVEVTITGEVAGIAFEGSDTIRVINPQPWPHFPHIVI